MSVVRTENHPVVNWKQATALLDWGFALPAGTAPVGTLVDSAPPPPTGSAGAPGPSGTFTGPATRGPSPIAVVGGAGALAAAVALVAIALIRRDAAAPPPRPASLSKVARRPSGNAACAET